MKDTIIQLLQQRMDKCTNEQFWAVASLTAADGFVVSSHKDIAEITPAWLVLTAISAAAIYGIWFVIQRHFAYYRNRRAMVTLLAHEHDAPDFLKRKSSPCSANSLSGVAFFVGWILAGCILCYFAMLQPNNNAV
jgi:hypothetical protein